VLTNADCTKIERPNGRNGNVVVTCDGEQLEAEQILIATGRKPQTFDIGLESVGLAPGYFIRVDDQLRATEVDGDWLYSVGDAKKVYTTSDGIQVGFRSTTRVQSTSNM
jgi:pyruvate/2-oxoglutarate dehydrogenase complex dihydrolipoamide dehydrogenase (E3) component